MIPKIIEEKLITVWVQIRDLYLYFFRHAIIVNGYVDDLTWQGIRHRNWGDDLNYYFLRELTGRHVIFYHNFKFAKWLHLKNYLCIGTLIDAKNCVNTQSVVWGAGVSGLERSFIHPAIIHAVRGPQTKVFCDRYGAKCPEVYGDPALLLSLIYNPNTINKKKKIGVIPNIADFNHPFIKDLMKVVNADYELINLSKYNNWTDVIDKICSCSCIFSSSLHGIIVSDVYQIPNCWISLTGKAIVGKLKFCDYASSVGRDFDKPIKIENISDLMGLSDDVFSCADPEIIKKLQEGLIKVAPFKLKV